jgi:hypothetical protein
MRTVALVTGIGWILFWAGWLIASLTAKSSTGRGRHFLAIRVALIVVVVIVVRLPGLHGGHHFDVSVASSPWAQGTGVALWAAGLALAVWARVYIGRNWGMPMTRRESQNWSPRARTVSSGTPSTPGSSRPWLASSSPPACTA